MRIVVLLLTAALAFGCASCEKNAAPAAPPTVALSSPTAAQPKLPTIKLYVGTNELETEMAVTAQQMQFGMMFRKSMSDTEGMIFVFAQPQRAGFWMRNVTVPLTCAYIDTQGIVRELHDMKPMDETSVLSQSDQIRFCLEVPQGWFQRHNLGPGVAVGTSKGTLEQVFLRGR